MSFRAEKSVLRNDLSISTKEVAVALAFVLLPYLAACKLILPDFPDCISLTVKDYINLSINIYIRLVPFVILHGISLIITIPNHKNKEDQQEKLVTYLIFLPVWIFSITAGLLSHDWLIFLLGVEMFLTLCWIRFVKQNFFEDFFPRTPKLERIKGGALFLLMAFSFSIGAYDDCNARGWSCIFKG